MIKAIQDLWKIFIGSIRDLQEPFARIGVGVGLILLSLIMVLAIGGMVFNFLENMTELIVNAITGIAPPL